MATSVPTPARPTAPATGQGSLLTPQALTAQFIGVAGPATGVGGVVTVITSILGALFGPIFGGGNDANVAIKQLRDEVVNVSNAILQVLVQVARALGKVIGFLGALLLNLFKPILKLLGKILEKLVDIYFKHLKPIIDAIQKIRARVLKIYERYLRPVLLAFQKVHQILTVLRLFHLKFAAKLDAELTNLEAKLFRPLYQMLGYLNQIANMLNLVFDAALVLRRAVILNALDQTKGSWTRMWWNTQTVPMDNDTMLRLQTDGQVPDFGQALSDFRQYGLDGTGPYAQVAAGTTAELARYG
jgi:hypothetical protein